MSESTSESMCPFGDVVIWIIRQRLIYNYPQVMKKYLDMFMKKRTTAPAPLLYKYLDIVAEASKKVPEDKRSQALRAGPDAMAIASELIESCINDEAVGVILNLLTEGDNRLIAETAKLVTNMFLDESKLGSGSHLIREMLKVRDNTFDLRCMYFVWGLGQSLKILFRSNINFSTNALTTLSLLLDICEDIPECKAKLNGYESNLFLETKADEYARFLSRYNIEEYIVKSFEALRMRLKALLYDDNDDDDDFDDSD